MIYNKRNLILTEYWVGAPYPFWWDGISFIDYDNFESKFIKGKFKSVSNYAHVKPGDLDKILRKALIGKIKAKSKHLVQYTAIHKFKYRTGRNRLMSTYEFGMIDL